MQLEVAEPSRATCAGHRAATNIGDAAGTEANASSNAGTCARARADRFCAIECSGCSE